MEIDPVELAKKMFAAGSAAAKGHAEDLKSYLEARAELIADGVAQIAEDRATRAINDADAKFAFEQIADSEATSLLAIDVTVKAAAQDAINAVLAVASAAVNEAVGFALL